MANQSKTIQYSPNLIERKWQGIWQKSGVYKVDLKKAKDKFYLLVEFTYPSGDLHMGHWFAFAIPDILARFKRMNGYSVFAPNGFDAFGLPAENAAIQRKIHPRDWTMANIKRMKAQFGSMGISFDWDHEVITCEPDYYKWNQWIFLKMYERGLAYRGKALANWCPKDRCVLANENVENGKCWRCGTEVVQKEVEQWFLKITDYAEKLIWRENAKVDWPQAVRDGQNNWIGKSEGALIKFKIKDAKDSIDVFTTRPDTLYGATFLVLAPEHKLVSSILKSKVKSQKSKVEEIRTYIQEAKKKSELERKEMKEKTGVFTGAYAVNPLNKESIPVWIADYALMGYGTGALFGDAHDERDVAFAKKYSIPLKPTIITGDKEKDVLIKNLEECFTGYGILIDSGEYSGLTSLEAGEKITSWLSKTGHGERKVVYHLHDWSISRQRYWGTPIPVIYCRNCRENTRHETPASQVKRGERDTRQNEKVAVIDGLEHTIVPVGEKDLPLELPYEVDFAPKGEPPLATAEEWVNVKCPNCGKNARREVETMDTFVDSSWYFLRYVRDTTHKSNVTNKSYTSQDLPWSPQLIKDWMPVDIYFGGAEHTLGHTLYSRFFVKFLHDEGLLDFSEYAKKRVHHGVILGPDGARMSKSRGNVVNPDIEVKKYGADAVRLYLAFLGPYDLVAPWDPNGLKGIHNFLQRVWKLASGSVGKRDGRKKGPTILQTYNPTDLHIMHKTIKKVTEDISANKFNTAISALMIWLNTLETRDRRQETGDRRQEPVTREETETFLLLLAPFAPHISEELYQQFFANPKSEIRNPKFNSIHLQLWPKFDEKLARASTIELVIQVNGKVRDKVSVSAGVGEEDAKKLALASDKVKKYIEGKDFKVIYVADKLINLVTSS